MRGSIRSSLVALAAVAGCLVAFGTGDAMASQLEAAGGIEVGVLRDDLSVAGKTPPSNAQYGADLLLENTNGALALTKGPVAKAVVINESPQFDSFVGLKLHSNPAASATSVATGYAVFADFQKSVASGVSSPVYPDNLIAPWRVDINGAKNAKPNVVTVTGVGLYFPTLGNEVRGVITGTYEAPGKTSPCPAGGVKLDLAQPGLTIGGATFEAGINNTVAEKNAFLCFVSADNYVYPEKPVGLGALTGEIKNN